jgi:hypothetical protein
MRNTMKAVLLILALLTLDGCDVGRTAKGGGNGGGDGPLPKNNDEVGAKPLAETLAAIGEEPLPDNIDGTYMIHALNDQGVRYSPEQVAERSPNTVS